MGVVVAGLALLPLVRGRVRAAVPLLVAAALPFAAIVGGYALLDNALYGIPIPNAGYFVIRDQQQVLALTPWIGGLGLLLDRTFGLLSHAPIYLLAFLGAVPLWRRWRATRSPAILALFLGWLLYFLYIADIFYWWADGSPSSRYQIASIAFLLVGVASGLEIVRAGLARWLAAGALAWSVAVTLIYALIPNSRYDIVADVRPTGGPGLLWTTVTRVVRVDPGLVFPSMVRAEAQDYAIAGVWLLIIAGLVIAGARWRGADTPAPHTASA
jgi:hypothetical protein